MNAFVHELRKPLTDQQRARLFIERGKRCHRCTREIMPGECWTDEHVIALECGGTNKWPNRDITCSWCKKPKDREDHGKAAKSRHVATAHVIAPSQRQVRNPLPGSRGHWSKLRRRMNGEIGRWE